MGLEEADDQKGVLPQQHPTNSKEQLRQQQQHGLDDNNSDNNEDDGTWARPRRSNSTKMARQRATSTSLTFYGRQVEAEQTAITLFHQVEQAVRDRRKELAIAAKVGQCEAWKVSLTMLSASVVAIVVWLLVPLTDMDQDVSTARDGTLYLWIINHSVLAVFTTVLMVYAGLAGTGMRCSYWRIALACCLTPIIVAGMDMYLWQDSDSDSPKPREMMVWSLPLTIFLSMAPVGFVLWYEYKWRYIQRRSIVDESGIQNEREHATARVVVEKYNTQFSLVWGFNASVLLLFAASHSYAVSYQFYADTSKSRTAMAIAFPFALWPFRKFVRVMAGAIDELNFNHIVFSAQNFDFGDKDATSELRCTRKSDDGAGAGGGAAAAGDGGEVNRGSVESTNVATGESCHVSAPLSQQSGTLARSSASGIEMEERSKLSSDENRGGDDRDGGSQRTSLLGARSKRKQQQSPVVAAVIVCVGEEDGETSIVQGDREGDLLLYSTLGPSTSDLLSVYSVHATVPLRAVGGPGALVGHSRGDALGITPSDRAAALTVDDIPRMKVSEFVNAVERDDSRRQLPTPMYAVGDFTGEMFYLAYYRVLLFSSSDGDSSRSISDTLILSLGLFFFLFFKHVVACTRPFLTGFYLPAKRGLKRVITGKWPRRISIEAEIAEYRREMVSALFNNGMAQRISIVVFMASLPVLVYTANGVFFGIGGANYDLEANLLNGLITLGLEWFITAVLYFILLWVFELDTMEIGAYMIAEKTGVRLVTLICVAVLAMSYHTITVSTQHMALF